MDAVMNLFSLRKPIDAIDHTRGDDDLPQFNLIDACNVARAFMCHPAVKNVELFGSIARGPRHEGEDIDVILIVDPLTAGQYIEVCRKRLDEYRAMERVRLLRRPDEVFPGREYLLQRLHEHASFYNGPGTRRRAAFEVMDERFHTAYTAASRSLPFQGNRAIDLFLFPPDWRDRLEFLQGFLPHKDPQFMHNIALDAKPISAFE